MLIELLKKGLINKEELLIKNYKKLNLNENQVVVILLIIKLGNEKIMTANEIANNMTLSSTQIEKEIDEMISEDLVKINSKSIDFTNLFVRLAEIIQNDYSDASSNDFLVQLNKLLDEDLSEDEINYLDEKVLSSISKEQILEISKEASISTFLELKKEINKKMNRKIKPITKFNWLEADED